LDLWSASSVIVREKILQVLHKTFQTDNRIVLAGKDGAGKTTLAREYIQHFGRDYQSVVWINATTDVTFLADLCAALQEFSLPVDIAQGTQGLFQTLHSYLSGPQKALLVLDHLPYAFMLQASPDQPPLSYHFLLLTHLTKTPPELPRLELTGLEAPEGALLVLRLTELLDEHDTLDTVEYDLRKDALELAREMQGSPIALRLAGKYLHETGCSIRDYLDLFREYPVHLQLPVGEYGNDQQELVVAGELSLSWIKQTHPEALDSLRICALLLPEAIPEALLQQESASKEEKAAQQKETIQILIAAGLLDADEDGSMLSMHPLIQQLVRQFCGLDEQPQQQKQVEQMLHRLLLLLPMLVKETLPARLRIAGHIQQLAKLSKQWELRSTEAAEVFAWAAMLLWEQNMLSQTEALLSRALTIWENAAEVTQITIAMALEKLATLNGQLKNYAEAAALAQRAIDSKIVALGVNHPDVLIVLNNLGQYYALQNKHNEAKACYAKVIEIGEVLKLRLHPVYSAASYNLAQIYIEQGEFEPAEQLLSSVCKVWSHTLGESNRSTVEARLKLAQVAEELKHWKQAEDCYRLVLLIYEQELGKDDPLTQEIGQKLEVNTQMQELQAPQRS
jgi:tetratricopeptide (TPR) repeat protein